jgi:hypothetical protein
LIKAHPVFGEAFKELGTPSPIGPFSTPRTSIYRANVFIMSFSISRSDEEQNQKMREVFAHLIRVGAKCGFTEYCTAPAFQDLVAGTYSFNDNVLLQFQNTLKDAIDPDGIIAPGRGGIWPKRYQEKRQ